MQLNILKNMSEGDKMYWKNLGQYFLIIVLLIIFLANVGDIGERVGFTGATLLVGVGAIFILGHNIAIYFSHSSNNKDNNK